MEIKCWVLYIETNYLMTIGAYNNINISLIYNNPDVRVFYLKHIIL